MSHQIYRYKITEVNKDLRKNERHLRHLIIFHSIYKRNHTLQRYITEDWRGYKGAINSQKSRRGY